MYWSFDMHLVHCSWMFKSQPSCWSNNRLGRRCVDADPLRGRSVTWLRSVSDPGSDALLEHPKPQRPDGGSMLGIRQMDQHELTLSLKKKNFCNPVHPTEKYTQKLNKWTNFPGPGRPLRNCMSTPSSSQGPNKFPPRSCG